ncbi:MAG: hypothetical protein O2885_04255 [Proteobacteria bacterium]|nr:hypothetical protein [Pseudomonadota bacterium]
MATGDKFFRLSQYNVYNYQSYFVQTDCSKDIVIEEDEGSLHDVYDEFGYWVDSDETDSDGNRRITTNDCDELLELEFSPSADDSIKFGIKLDNQSLGSHGGGIILSKTTAMVSENGTSDGFSVKLFSPPSADVWISVVSSDPSEVYSLPYNITFTSGNWNVPQVVSLAGIDDMESDGDQSISITLTASSSDYNYDGVINTMVVTNVDDE